MSTGKVRGVLRFPPGAPGEYLRVRVAIQSLEAFDAPAPTLAVTEIGPVSAPDAGAEIPFEVDLPADQRIMPMTLALRAHADRIGDSQVSVGDLVTTSTVWVPQDGSSVTLDLDPV